MCIQFRAFTNHVPERQCDGIQRKRLQDRQPRVQWGGDSVCMKMEVNIYRSANTKTNIDMEHKYRYKSGYKYDINISIFTICFNIQGPMY